MCHHGAMDSPNMVQTEVLRTARLRLRWFEPEAVGDQDFVLSLLNDPDWIAYIGKHDVSTRQQAEAYLRNGPRGMCERLGFGLYAVERLSDGVLVGMCGLLRRDTLADADLGYAFVPAGRGQGYAREAAGAVLGWARRALGLRRVLAIVTPDNRRSIALLAQLGFVDEGEIRQPPDDTALRLMAWNEPSA